MEKVAGSRPMRLYYPESRSRGFTHIDGTMAFYTRVNSLISSRSLVLDVGCGRGAYGDDPVRVRRRLRVLRGKCKRVVGIDVEEAARSNPFLDEFVLVTANRWPFESESVDLCLCDSVLEHVRDPETLFSECARVLKPGGFLCIRTSNALSYVGLLSRAIPSRLRPALLRWGQGRRPQEVFPTFHRCNTIWRIRRMLHKHGFTHCVYGYEAEPSYLSFSRLVYGLGVLHQRLAPGYLRTSIFAFARRRAAGDRAHGTSASVPQRARIGGRRGRRCG